MDISRLRQEAISLKQTLGLNSSPVGVKFILASDEPMPPGRATRLSGHRYCQALMKARHGAHVLLDAEGIACPAAAAAFGFRPLPEGLKTGKGLVGFGIVEDEKTAQAMFEGMTVLPQGQVKALYLFPLETADVAPDIVVLEDETERLMWIALANLNVKGGHRVISSTAILQATCVDATLIPYVERKFNMSMGCYGCRDATDIGPHEAVLGFPIKDFDAIVESVLFLGRKAIPDSRAKKALAALKRKEVVEHKERNT
jgi:uncharacterized protein (DUF169 family)